MYSICSLDKDDVLKSIIAMKQRGYRGPVVQTSNVDYERLKYQKNGVREYADGLLSCSKLVINLIDNTLHIDSCSQIKAKNDDVELIDCHIIDPHTTGLSLCGCCK